MALRVAVFASILLPATASWLGSGPKPVVRRASGQPAITTTAPAVSMSAGSLREVKVGLVGGGTVGGGIVETLGRKAEFIRDQLGVDLKVVKIVVGDTSKKRDFSVPPGCEVISDTSAVLDDPEIDMVVEVMGGTNLAKEVVVSALKAGKHVVTANKALIAQDLPELQQLVSSINAKRPSTESVQFGYEAAVCGGIPIIHALQRDFIGDDITQLSGIINGCTNFILSNMASGGKSYADALSEASELGYAEADPTLDVGGFDARSKLRIMMKLAFGIDVSEEEIPCRGITDVTSTDFEYAGLIGGTVKLLGIAKVDASDSSRISAFVSPVFVPSSNTLHGISGATNAVEVDSRALGQSVFVGQGAGRYPTANSCVSDILAIAQGDTSIPFPKEADPSLKFVNSFESAFYVRIRFRDATGIIQQVGEELSKCGVSIYSILQNPIEDKNDAYFVVMTDPVEVGKIKQACVRIESLDWCLGNTFYMPVL